MMWGALGCFRMIWLLWGAWGWLGLVLGCVGLLWDALGWFGLVWGGLVVLGLFAVAWNGLGVWFWNLGFAINVLEPRVLGFGAQGFETWAPGLEPTFWNGVLARPTASNLPEPQPPPPHPPPNFFEPPVKRPTRVNERARIE